MKRVAWTFLCGMLCAFRAQAALQNEWTFESDPSGRPLTEAYNFGSALFAGSTTNFQSTVFTASATNFQSSAGNRVLLCVGADTASNAWNNGAILNAGLTSATSGVHYLRYDVAYNLATNDNSGTVLGVYFTGTGGGGDDRSAGLVLGYDKSTSQLGTSAPARRPIASMTGLATNGSLIAIAEVNLSSNTLKVWYSVNGTAPANYNSPAASKSIVLTSISNLCFHATGNFRPAGLTNYAAVDNVRMADSWTDITAPVPDFSKGTKVEISRFTISNSSGTVTNPITTVGTDVGKTNIVEVVIRSLGAPASNVTSSVTNDTNPAYFTITSGDAPAELTYPQYVTNTFSLVINTNAEDNTYTFYIGAAAAGGASAYTNFSLTVGSLIKYITNSITVVSTSGILADKYEPGEILEITVFSQNKGTVPVSNIVNSLSADPAYVTITNLTSINYPLLDIDAVTSTIYQVTIKPDAPHIPHLWFSVTNRIASKAWQPGSFEIEVFLQGIPSVSPGAITINALNGYTVTNTEVVGINAGNAALTFNITDDGSWDAFYDVTTGLRGKSAFTSYKNTIVLKDPNTNSLYVTSTNEGVSSAVNIGFNFPLYGETYSNFYVTADGYIGLSNTTNVPAISTNSTGALPAAGGVPLIAPFWGTLKSPAGSIRYTKNSKYLAISYNGVSKEGSGSNLVFQVALYPDGVVEFRYKSITGRTNIYGRADAVIGVQGSTRTYTNLTVVPVNGTSVRLTPQRNRWVTYPTQNITVGPQSSVGVAFTVDAAGRAANAGTNFNAWFNWSTGGSNLVFVTVNVTTAAPVYSAVSSLSFTGAAGQMASAIFVINNTNGTSPLTFTISATNAMTAGYSYTNDNSAYKWIDISTKGTKIALIDPDPTSVYVTAADEGFSARIPIKFAFPFYGGSYTQFCVSVNGALRLDTTGRVFVGTNLASTASTMPAQMIAPYWGDLVVDANTTIKYRSTAEQLVITWENIKQNALNGGSNLTFQAVLAPSGDITFQYKRLEGGGAWPLTTIGLRDTTNRTKQADIRLPDVWIVSTNLSSGVVSTQFVRSVDRIVSTNLFGAVSTQYVNVVSNRAVQFRPAQIRTIGYTPRSGTIAAGGSAEITITGDASNQADGTNNISTNTILTIVHNAPGKTNTLAVTFTVTNSFEAVFVRAVAGDIAEPAVDIAQPAPSVFSPKVDGAPGAISLSWTDGTQRTYIIYSTTDLMGSWDYLDTVINGMTYLDRRNIDVPAIYYKIIVAE